MMKAQAERCQIFGVSGLRTESVLPGDHLVTDDGNTVVTTLLGSCVAACIRDRTTGTGGLNHFLLPGKEEDSCARYGTYAMEVLINDILSRGAMRANLEAKVFGGGAVIASTTGLDIGLRNGDFVRQYLRNEGIRIVAEDLGGNRGRRLYYYPGSGEARVQYLNAAESKQMVVGETRLERRLETKPQVGSVELFG